VRALSATSAAPRKLCARALASYFAFGAVSTDEAILEGVRRLPPGHTLEWKGGRISIERYWRLPIGRAAPSTFDDEVRELRPILKEAVRLRLIADVPVGIFLSGGIDSSVLVALATQASDTPVHTFTVTFDEAAYSEAPYAAEVARRFGCTHPAGASASEPRCPGDRRRGAGARSTRGGRRQHLLRPPRRPAPPASPSPSPASAATSSSRAMARSAPSADRSRS